MYKIFFILITIIATASAIAQPYVDPLNIRLTKGFNSKNATPFTHTYIGSDLPIKLKNNAFLVFSPFYENWNIDSADNKNFLPGVSSIALPLTAIVPLDKNYWLLTITAISRYNSEDLKLKGYAYQFGGAIIANYKRKETLKYKFGVYINSEFFGLFVMPLAGIDWNINQRNNLFGILPGRLTYEHKLSNHFYTGATFRAITNSYRLTNDNYLRIDDNQLSAFLDCYATKNIVFTLEPGAGILRKLRSGTERNKNYSIDYNWSDGLFFKLSASYRIRINNTN